MEFFIEICHPNKQQPAGRHHWPAVVVAAHILYFLGGQFWVFSERDPPTDLALVLPLTDDNGD
jgi:hypothetical protein